jgi:hypothetical protein
VRSIRANLVLWVVGTLALGTVVVLASTYLLTRNEVGRLFDEELRQVALAVHLREDWTQTRRVRIARPGFALSVRAYDNTGRIYFETALPSLPPDLPQSFAEGIASRGDRRIGRVIERVWREGGTFQEWGEHFDLGRWLDAMAAEGLSPDWYVTRHRTQDEVLPWEHLTAGLHKDFLWDDWRAALDGHGLEDCRWTPCYDCGVCTGYGIEHVVASSIPPAGGSQGTGQDLAHGGAVPVTLTKIGGR